MSISINYLRELPIENLYLNTIPLAILVLGLAEFFVFHVSLDWRKEVYNFLTGSKTSNKSQLYPKDSKVMDGKKNQDVELSKETHDEIESVSREEIEMIMKSLGILSKHEDEKLDQESLNRDDLFSLFEENKVRFDEVKEAFDVFDENKDGFIDAMELQRIFIALGLNVGFELDNCKMMISVFDENKDGRIDFDEFVNFMENIDF